MTKRLSTQSGLVLPLVLIFLVIMMLLGTAVIRNVTLEEKMAGNMRNRNLAFQAAEQALRFCENSLQFSSTAVNGVNVLPKGPIPAGRANAGREYWESDASWGDATISTAIPRSPAELATNSAALAVQPRCMVELLGSVNDTSRTAQQVIESGDQKLTYRVTARGVGLDANTVVQLQSYLVM